MVGRMFFHGPGGIGKTYMQTKVVLPLCAEHLPRCARGEQRCALDQRQHRPLHGGHHPVAGLALEAFEAAIASLDEASAVLPQQNLIDAATAAESPQRGRWMGSSAYHACRGHPPVRRLPEQTLKPSPQTFKEKKQHNKRRRETAIRRAGRGWRPKVSLAAIWRLPAAQPGAESLPNGGCRGRRAAASQRQLARLDTTSFASIWASWCCFVARIASRLAIHWQRSWRI